MFLFRADILYIGVTDEYGVKSGTELNLYYQGFVLGSFTRSFDTRFAAVHDVFSTKLSALHLSSI